MTNATQAIMEYSEAGLDDIVFIVASERFTLPPLTLSSLGAACMLNHMLENAGAGNVHVVTWPPPLTVRSFALVVEWAKSARIPTELSIRECGTSAGSIESRACRAAARGYLTRIAMAREQLLPEITTVRHPRDTRTPTPL